ncbi:MAG TPA: class I SAM-dependent methyltransferase, partial [Lachnospiraceae bacterium]|nr:class I SAM-dependent methyltransferase [Lachnospiraceae bacterium]
IDHAGKVAGLLLEKGIIKDADVLDIGGGTGRYAVPFAEYAKEVTIADVSSQMMAYAKENAEKVDRRNLQYVRLNWEEADLKELGWEKRYDLVFASMCPAVMSGAGIEKMSAASRGRCQINQLFEMTDNISRRLAEELKIERNYDPHNDRDTVQGIFNVLWLQGLEPEITYLRDTKQQVLSVDEALPQYSHRFGKAALEKGIEIKSLLEQYAGGKDLTIESSAALAMICWKV